MILDSLLGTFTYFRIEVAETASGGDMMPPNRNPNASVNPGIILLDTKAIRKDVSITIINAKEVITRRHFQNSFQDVYHAASYSRGGRKSTIISSGLMVIAGIAWVTLSISPPTTRIIGYAIFSFSDSITRNKMIMIRMMY
jgi:hypothetical protein